MTLQIYGRMRAYLKLLSTWITMQIHTEYRFIPSDHILYTFYDRLSDLREREREENNEARQSRKLIHQIGELGCEWGAFNLC